mgnify:CR=1 FL=1
MFEDIRALSDVIGAGAVIALAALVIVLRFGPWRRGPIDTVESILGDDEKFVTTKRFEEALQAGREINKAGFRGLEQKLDAIKSAADIDRDAAKTDRQEAAQDRQNLVRHIGDGDRHN